MNGVIDTAIGISEWKDEDTNNVKSAWGKAGIATNQGDRGAVIGNMQDQLKHTHKDFEFTPDNLFKSDNKLKFLRTTSNTVGVKAILNSEPRETNKYIKFQEAVHNIIVQ